MATNKLLVNRPDASKEVITKRESLGFFKREGSPKLSRNAGRRVIAEYEEFDAFKASSLTRGGKRVMR